MDCYIWVKLYLVKRRLMEMNGIESYVYGYIKGKQIGYIPTNASFALKRAEARAAADLN